MRSIQAISVPVVHLVQDELLQTLQRVVHFRRGRALPEHVLSHAGMRLQDEAVDGAGHRKLTGLLPSGSRAPVLSLAVLGVSRVGALRRPLHSGGHVT